MKLTIASSLCLASLLRFAAAVPSSSHEARQDVEIQSVNLVFKSGCKRQAEIEKAWDDAVRLVVNLPKIKWNDAAAVDYFGPPALNKAYQSKIQAVFDNAKTFGQGWKITPTPFKVVINVHCGVEQTRELDAQCKAKAPDVRAYTWNTKNTDGTGDKFYNNDGATMNMYICNSFFAKDDLDVTVDKIKKDPDYEVKYGMQHYTNRAYIILHEMMHANRVAYYANGNRHINDMRMQIWVYVGKDDGHGNMKYTTKLKWIDAYGSSNTKILARTNQKGIASDITINADNYAQYILAKYVQSKIGQYPWLPIVNSEAVGDIKIKSSQLVVTDAALNRWGVLDPNYSNHLKVGSDDLSFTVRETIDPADASNSPPLTNLEWTGDDKYPSDYIKELKEWAAKSDGNTPTPAPASGQQIALCSYINPLGDPNAWTRMFAYDTKKVSVLVANVLNGPDYVIDQAWKSVIDKAAASGKKIIGYVRTGYLGVSTQAFVTRLGSHNLADWVSQIEQDIDKWYELYGSTLGGIFFDEGWPECGPNNIYADIYAHINNYTKRKHAGAYTVLNPGSPIAQCYENTMDTLMTFESSYEKYKSSYVPNTWTPKDPRKIWHLIYKVPQAEIASIAALAWSRSAGLLQITDDDNPNPYDTIPNEAYMQALLNAVPGAALRVDAPGKVSGSYVAGLPTNAAVTSSDYSSVILSWSAVNNALGYGIYKDGALVLELPATLTRATVGMINPGTSSINFEVRTLLASGGGGASRFISASTMNLPPNGTITNVGFTVNGDTVTYKADVLVPYAFVRLFIGKSWGLLTTIKGWPIQDPVQIGGTALHQIVNYMVEGNEFYSGLYKYTGAWNEFSKENADWSWTNIGTAPQKQSGYTYTWTVPFTGTDAKASEYLIQGQGYAPYTNVFRGTPFFFSTGI